LLRGKASRTLGKLTGEKGQAARFTRLTQMPNRDDRVPRRNDRA
jgi:hypothetical protein